MIVLIVIFAIVIIGLIFDLQVTKSVDSSVNKMAIACFIVLECVLIWLRFIEPIYEAIYWLKNVFKMLSVFMTPERTFVFTAMAICITLFTLLYFKNRRERKEFLASLTPGRTVTVYIYSAMGVGRKQAKITSVNKKLKVVNTDKGHFKFRNIVI